MRSVKNNVNSKRRSKRSRGRRRRLTAALFIIVALLAAIVIVRALWPRPATVAAVVLRATPTPAAWTPSQQAHLRNVLRAAFAAAIGEGANYSFAVLDADGRTLYDDHASIAVIPASVQKLVVADAALNLLGPSYRFHTQFASLRGIGNDGIIAGDLWLVGSGDPSFRSDDLQRGVDALARAGVRAIEGGIRVDASALRGPEDNPHWDPADAGEDFSAPTSGISLDGDTAEFRVYGAAPGEAARVVVLPRGSVVRLHGGITTSYGSDAVIIAPQETPNTFELSGSIPANAEEKFWLPVHGIPAYAGDALATMLREANVRMGRAPAMERAPLDAVTIWDHRSAPLRALVGHMLFLSDNHYAEQLLRVLGGEAGDAPDDAGGIAAEIDFLRERGIPTAGLRAFDGSGLAEGDRVSAMTLARILSDADVRGGGTESFYGLLPQGGRDGTLKHYHFTTALGHVRAKTGHLSDADSLAGYVNTARHGRIAFAFMINDSPGRPDTAYVHAIDALAAL